MTNHCTIHEFDTTVVEGDQITNNQTKMYGLLTGLFKITEIFIQFGTETYSNPPEWTRNLGSYKTAPGTKTLSGHRHKTWLLRVMFSSIYT